MMTTNEFKKLIEADIIKNVFFSGFYNGDKLVWQVSASDYIPSESPIEPGKSPGNTWDWHNSSRSKEPKEFTSLDRAWNAVRKLGYIGTVWIE